MQSPQTNASPEADFAGQVHLPLKVINLWGGPGSGKSTLAAGLFNIMKSLGFKVELALEAAKDETYEGNRTTLDNQFLLAALQDHRLRRLVGHVDWVVTDSPIPIGEVYTTPEYIEWVPWAEAYERYNNYDVFVQRTKPYAIFGRNQTEAEAHGLDVRLRALFEEYVEVELDDVRAEQGTNNAYTVTGDPSGLLKLLGYLGFKEDAPHAA